MHFVGISERLRPELRELRPYEAGRADARVKLDANESPYGLSEAAREDLGRELARVDLHRYPDSHSARLREIFAEGVAIDPSRVLVGSGVDEIIALLATAFARPSRQTDRASMLVPCPSFAMFRITGRGHGLHVAEVPLDENWGLPLEPSLSALQAEDPGLILLPSPNNPTGNRFDGSVLRAIVETATNSLVVVDEAYHDFCGQTLLPIVNVRPNLAIFRTLSKMGLAALRIGFIVAQPEVIGALEKVRQPYNINALSQRAAELILTRYQPELRSRVQEIVKSRDQLGRDLRGIPTLTVFPSEANFILVRLPRASEVWNELSRRGVLVRNLDVPGPTAGCLRVTVGTPLENEVLLTTLLDVVRSYPA